MARWILAAGFSLWLTQAGGQVLPPAPAPPPPSPAKAEPQYAKPPEEDGSVAVKQVYAFNPLQAKKEMETGDFYMKQGNYRGAALRYREATLWDGGSADAFFKLGEAAEKVPDYRQAREAFGKFLELTTDKKKSEDVKKRVAKMPKVAEAAEPDGPVTVKDALEQERGAEGDLRQKGIYRRQ